MSELEFVFKCPTCGSMLERKCERVVQPRLFSTNKKDTKYREAFYCKKCDKTFVKTIAFVEVQVQTKKYCRKG